ncbi:MAG: hypothetical protein Q7N50_14005 [Armatimonadota bacterium]|nr:hypothetical protein [Armatimonadota bacterium]
MITVKKLELIIIALALTLPGIAMCAQPSVPRGSYLRNPVSSVDELVTAITKDAVVSNRFARHFNQPPDKLAMFIQDNVILTRVTEATPHNVYVFTRNGQMFAQRKVLRRGTPVFALKDTGEPLLIKKCGNPVIKKLPVREKVKAEAPQMYQVVRASEVPLPPPLAVLPSVTTPPSIPVAIAPTVVAAVPSSVAPAIIPHKRNPNLLPLAGLLLTDHGGGKKPPPPIPEPAGAAAVIATGILPAAGWAIRKFRSQRVSVKVD